VRDLTAELYQVPTESPEGDGTLTWNQTTMLLVRVEGSDGTAGMGYAYTGPGADVLVRNGLREAIAHLDDDDVGTCWNVMVDRVRNYGRQGIAASAISAVDIALWDARARRRGLPLFRALPTFRRSVPIYGSGGFTTYSTQQVVDQLSAWVEQGMKAVKMKIGLGLDADVERVMAAREALGPRPELMIDANGRYAAKEAIALAHHLAEATSYFEEPVSSDALAEMVLVRKEIPQDLAAGEYGYDPWYFWNMLQAGAVDILQADATRCLGVTGFLFAGHAAHAAQVRFSAHTAPSIHAHAGCGVPQLSHVEYFHDHVRLEGMLFDGASRPSGGELAPDPTRPGLGLALKPGAERFRVA
jgi:L-alanine-DL-glutamate epimerase-like enolase superfamily enzyme